MTRTMAVLMAFACLLVAGCVSAPPKQDPFAGIEIPPAAEQAAHYAASYKHLTLGLILSENTRKAVEYNRKNVKLADSMNLFGLGYNLDSSKLFEQTGQILQLKFRKVVRIETVEQASASGADLVVVLDMYIKQTAWVWQKDTMMTDAVFLTLDNKPIDRIQVETGKKASDYPGFAGNTKAKAALDAGLLENKDKFEKGVLSSLRLGEFARSRPGGTAAGPSVAEGPATAPPMLQSSPYYHSDVDVPGFKLAEDPRRFALVIGVERYKSLPAADFAARDAFAVRGQLLALGTPSRNILFLTESDAVKSSVEKYLEAWLPRNLKEDSRLFVYFSGHGAPDPQNGEAYLVPWDGDAKFLANTAYPLKRLYEKLNGLKAKEIIVALDACFSGAGGRSILAEGTRPLVSKVDQGFAGPGPVVVLAASAGEEITGTDKSQGHGVFTYHLLKGISEKKGEITVGELYDYLLPRVQDHARRDNRDQTPQLLPMDLGGKARMRLR